MLSLLLGCAPPPPGPTGHLVYATDAGLRDLDLAAGTSTPLRGPAGTLYPGPPDPLGALVPVVAVTADGQALWFVPRDGGAPVETGVHGGRVRGPTWSPDGAWLVVESDAASYADIWRVPRDGGRPTRLTAAPDGSFEPVADAAGRVVYASSRDGNAELYLQARGVVTRLTDHPADDMHPQLSPDGLRLAWLTRREGPARVWTMATDGTGAAPLRPGDTDDTDVVWAPDGRRLAVETCGHVEVVDAATGAAVDLGVGSGPAWSPDGAWLAFSSTRSGVRALHVATPDGGDVRRVTNGGGDWLPRWQRSPP